MKAIIVFLLATITFPAFSSEASFKDGATRFTIHYSAFNSTFLLPDIARSYNIERSSKLGLINISVLKNGKPVKAEVKIESANLMAQKFNLKTWLIDEGDAMYYLASFPISNDELLHFTLQISPDGSKRSKTITFSQKFYED